MVIISTTHWILKWYASCNTVYWCIPHTSPNKQRSFPHTELTDGPYTLLTSSVYAVRWKLDFRHFATRNMRFKVFKSDNRFPNIFQTDFTKCNYSTVTFSLLLWLNVKTMAPVDKLFLSLSLLSMLLVWSRIRNWAMSGRGRVGGDRRETQGPDGTATAERRRYGSHNDRNCVTDHTICQFSFAFFQNYSHRSSRRTTFSGCTHRGAQLRLKGRSYSQSL